jgi:hypothetical protein
MFEMPQPSHRRNKREWNGPVSEVAAEEGNEPGRCIEPQSTQSFTEDLNFQQAAQKGPDARRRGMRGARRTYSYVAAPRERANAADGPFSAAC